MRNNFLSPMQLAAVSGLMVVAALLAGCSTELASFDDTYVPASVEENFPIKVVERPRSMTAKATANGVRPDDVPEIARFGREAAATAANPIAVHYASGKAGQQSARQAAAILAQQGVPRHSIRLTPGGNGNVLTLSYSARMAETKPCGAWPENLRANQFNESGTAFGCAIQQNIAAMVANPNDFDQARQMPPSLSAPQTPALNRHVDGTWTTPTADSEF